MIVLSYDMKFRITLFDVIEQSPICTVLSSVFSSVDTKKRSKLLMLQYNPNFDYWRRKNTTVDSLISGHLLLTDKFIFHGNSLVKLL